MGNLTRAVYTSKRHWNNRRALETRKGSIDQRWHTWGEDNISFTPSGKLQIIVSSTCTWNLLSFGNLYDLSILVVPRREASLGRLKYGEIIFTHPRNIFDPQLNSCQLFRIYFLSPVNFELFPPFLWDLLTSIEWGLLLQMWSGMGGHLKKCGQYWKWPQISLQFVTLLYNLFHMWRRRKRKDQ